MQLWKFQNVVSLCRLYLRDFWTPVEASCVYWKYYFSSYYKKTVLTLSFVVNVKFSFNEIPVAIFAI